jgi:signal peptidase I
VDGDFIFVNKFSYGLRLPVLNSKILATGQPQRGDVIVFRLPSDPSIHYIKRLIGLPGDHIVVRDNSLFINGAHVQAKRDGEYTGGYGFSGADLEIERFGERDHLIMLAKNRLSTDYDSVVPPASYFFMGDNRNDSEDSRFAQVGFVPEKNLDGTRDAHLDELATTRLADLAPIRDEDYLTALVPAADTDGFTAIRNVTGSPLYA